MRQRPITIGGLGRAPARAGERIPPTRLTPEPEPPEPRPIRRWLRGALLENVGLKFLSLVLAVTVFLLVNTDRDREITTNVKVITTLPADKVLVSGQLDQVRVTIRGSWRRLREFDDRTIEPVDLDLRNTPTGDVAITEDMIRTSHGHLPAGLTIASISPSVVHVVFERRREKVVPVSPTVSGHARHGYLVTQLQAIPPTVTVRGAEGALAALAFVQTREVSVEGRSESFVADTEAVADGVEVVGDPHVEVRIAIDEQLVTRKFPGQAVAIRGDGVDPTKWQIVPGSVDVTLTGALLAVEKTEGTLHPVVKLAATDRGPREVDVSIEGIPPGIGVKVSPDRVKLVPAPKQPAPTAPPAPSQH